MTLNIVPEPSDAVVDTTLLRRAFGAFATGVTVITVGGRNPHAMTANSFTSVSLDPPLVLVSVDRSAIMHGVLQTDRRFAVSVLSAHQEAVARHFADKRRPLGMAQFDGVDWVPGPHTGAPLIEGAVVRFECELWRSYDGGDHTLFVGSLVAMDRPTDHDALLFFHGRFRRIDPERSELSA